MSRSGKDVKCTSDLRRLLIETIDQLRRKEITVAEASAVANLTKVVLQSAKLDLEFATALARTESLPADRGVRLVGEPVPQLESEELRDQILRYLQKKQEPVKTALIAADLGVSSQQVEEAVSHEWFEKLTTGIAVVRGAERRR